MGHGHRRMGDARRGRFSISQRQVVAGHAIIEVSDANCDPISIWPPVNKELAALKSGWPFR
jgi:hypothetical protein